MGLKSSGGWLPVEQGKQPESEGLNERLRNSLPHQVHALDSWFGKQKPGPCFPVKPHTALEGTFTPPNSTSPVNDAQASVLFAASRGSSYLCHLSCGPGMFPKAHIFKA